MSTSTNEFDGERVAEIGGSSGFGLATAKAVAQAGDAAVVVSSHRSSVDRALAELPATAEGYTVDAPDPDALDVTLDRTLRVFSRPAQPGTDASSHSDRINIDALLHLPWQRAPNDASVEATLAHSDRNPLRPPRPSPRRATSPAETDRDRESQSHYQGTGAGREGSCKRRSGTLAGS